jgi:hypothetical protein
VDAEDFHSYYPIFPVPCDLSHEINLDITHAEGLKLCEGEEEVAPDVLVTPSRLKHFSKVRPRVSSTIFTNYGQIPVGRQHRCHQPVVLDERDVLCVDLFGSRDKYEGPTESQCCQVE